MLGGCVSPPGALLTENEFTASPVPPTHGSNPAWMLVRYHERWAYPRLTASLKNVLTVKLSEFVGDVRRYETTFQPMLPNHTSQLAPRRLTVPTWEPTGKMPGVQLSHTMISAPVT